MLMWTDGEVFRSYGAQKADLKGVDFFFFFSASFLIAYALSHAGCSESSIPSLVAASRVKRKGDKGSWKILALDLQALPVNRFLNFPG